MSLSTIKEVSVKEVSVISKLLGLPVLYVGCSFTTSIMITAIALHITVQGIFLAIEIFSITQGV